ncbi:MAG TPA: hypothetical protein VHW64_11910 [Nocardioides sp.]|uniref:hypothetical protein n=1 Tax=Nocardioides sp. TaxID=35761 RepID=UPI002E323060|nr:hypothetical protein [Nocardioides sp.]HEX3931405.1 hypothetical protein [Nocardioides sp.]
MATFKIRRGMPAGLVGLLAIAMIGLPVSGAGAAQGGSTGKSSGKLSALQSRMWRPDGTVNVVATHGKSFYIGGDFKNVWNSSLTKSQRRVRIAALSSKTGAPIKAFHPHANGEVDAIAVFHRALYIGGDFTKVNGKSRHHLAVLRLSTGKLLPVKGLRLDGPVYSLLHLRNRLYVGGDFRYVGKVHQARLFSVNPSGHLAEGWPASPRGANGPVFSLAAAPGHKAVLVGGHFHQLLNKPKVNLGAVSLRGRLMKWTPPAVCLRDCPVRDLVASRKLVYAGIDGPGGRIRAYRWSTGRTAWADKTDGDVDAVALVGDTVLIGGHFTEVSDLAHKMFAIVDSATGAVSDRVETSSGTTFPGILDIRVSHGVALLGGAFDDVAGQGRLAAVAP